MKGLLTNIIGAVAPTLGTALGGPMGGMAAKMISEVLGVPNNSKSINQAMAVATPEQMLQLKQAEQAFIQNSNLINASYKAFDTLADTIGNPKVIPTGHVKFMAKNYVDELSMKYPGLRGYAEDTMGNIDMKALEKLQGTGDPLALFFRYMNKIDDFVTPKQYKGMMETLNRAIGETSYDNIRPTLWSIREALENDLNSFGANITKETFLKDDTVKAAYEALKKSNPGAAEADMALRIKARRNFTRSFLVPAKAGTKKAKTRMESWRINLDAE